MYFQRMISTWFAVDIIFCSYQIFLICFSVKFTWLWLELCIDISTHIRDRNDLSCLSHQLNPVRPCKACCHASLHHIDDTRQNADVQTVSLLHLKIDKHVLSVGQEPVRIQIKASSLCRSSGCIPLCHCFNYTVNNWIHINFIIYDKGTSVCVLWTMTP